MRATSTFIRLDGIDTDSCRAPAAFRTRVSMSPTGSVTVTPRGRLILGAVTRRGGRGASPPGCSVVVVAVTSVVISVLFLPATSSTSSRREARR